MTVEETLKKLMLLQARMLGALVERRQQRPPGAPTRLQEFVLRAIADRKGMQVSDLVTLLDISPATTSQLLSAMEQKGWLERTILPEDRRRHLVALTEAGQVTVQQREAKRLERFARVLAELTPTERVQLVALAERLVEIASREETSKEAF